MPWTTGEWKAFLLITLVIMIVWAAGLWYRSH